MRRSILVALSLLLVLAVAPSQAQEMETFVLNAVSHRALPLSLEILVSIDPTVVGLPAYGDCAYDFQFSRDQLQVIAEELPYTLSEYAGDADSFFAMTFYDPSFDETVFQVFGMTNGQPSFFLFAFALPGALCDGVVPLNWTQMVPGSGVVSLSGPGLSWGGLIDSISGLTPDEDEPFVSCAEEGLKGALFGLCNAYCEAMMCGTAEQQASDKACSAVARNYMKKSGGEPPPCEF
jgi:hypothetical protein